MNGGFGLIFGVTMLFILFWLVAVTFSTHHKHLEILTERITKLEREKSHD